MSDLVHQEANRVESTDSWHVLYALRAASSDVERVVSEHVARSSSVVECYAGLGLLVDVSLPHVLLRCTETEVQVAGHSDAKVVLVRGPELREISGPGPEGGVHKEAVEIGDRIIYSAGDFRPYFQPQQIQQMVIGSPVDDVGGALGSVAKIRGFEDPIAGFEVGSLLDWGRLDDDVTFDGLLAGIDALIETSEVFLGTDAAEPMAIETGSAASDFVPSEAVSSSLVSVSPMARLLVLVEVHRARLAASASPRLWVEQRVEFDREYQELARGTDEAVARDLASVAQLMAAEFFNRLRIDVLTRKLDRTRQGSGQLAEAGEAQRLLLPLRKCYQNDSLAYATQHASAEEAGGDCWTAVELKDGRWLFMVGQVTGAGLAASLFTGVVRGALEVATTGMGAKLTVRGLARVLGLVMRRTGRRQFHMAASIFTLEPETGAVEWVSASGVPPLLVQDGKVTRLSMSRDPVLGTKSRVDYTVTRLRLEHGEALVVCTEGVLERLDPEGQAYGRERLSAALGACPTAAGDLASAVHLDLQEFARGQAPEADLTLLVVERRR